MPSKKQASSSRANAKKAPRKSAPKKAAKKAAPRKSARSSATAAPSTPPQSGRTAPIVAERPCRARLQGHSVRCELERGHEGPHYRTADGPPGRKAAGIEWGEGIQGYRPAGAR